MIFHIFGLSGVGKTTLTENVVAELRARYKMDFTILDGDIFRNTFSKDLGFSESDRKENVKRMIEAARNYTSNGNIAFVSAISPYDSVRCFYKCLISDFFLVWLKCDTNILIKRDPKGLYKRAFLEESNPAKIFNLSGINSVFEAPQSVDLIIDTSKYSLFKSKNIMLNFIQSKLSML